MKLVYESWNYQLLNNILCFTYLAWSVYKHKVKFAMKNNVRRNYMSEFAFDTYKSIKTSEQCFTCIILYGLTFASFNEKY